ncbi:uncharacterized protein UTRI_03539_B [Ustilago trichophora]|uniref:DNA replication factor Cdt1 C-terminal domain-containing protein n=1 Tax=Ustilago trichophora TaxID=86804 RepID=A0A5C3E2U2_9BASI|nr:uncharacterized protein UTRI_03539_B [Ustilago trichophora]
MAPNRGIAAHFAASKASISRSNRSAKSKLVKDAVAIPAKADIQPAQPDTAPVSTSDNVASAADSAPVVSPSKPSTPKKPTARRQTRTRLRTPDEGEVDRMIAENDRILQASPSRLPSTQDVAPVALLGTPPTTPRASARSARFSPLLEATHTSPISVRTDPDTKKMFLLLPKSKPATPSSSTPFPASGSSPTKRKNVTPPKTTSPTKTPRTLDGTPRRLITGEPEMFGTEEEDGLVLTPGRAKGTRVVLGSPSKSPLLAKLGDTPKEQALRRIVDEDEEGYITPRGVRERAKGSGLPQMATQAGAAVFRGAQLPASSSLPSLVQRKVENSHATSSLVSSGLSHTEVDSESTTAEEVELPAPKHTLSADLPLPSFYSSLMTLHVALEHALVVHLATAGCSSATLQSSSSTSSDSDSDSDLTPRKKTKTVRLPNLISYTALRPLVERSGGRRLGLTELRRLASVWVDFHRTSSRPDLAPAEEEDEVRGLGFIITKTRSMDPRTGRRALDWGIGIELEIKRTVRERTPPTQVNFGGVEVQSSPILPQSATEAFDETLQGTPKMRTRFTTPPPSSERKLVAKSSPFAQSSSPLLSSPRRKVRATSPTPSSPKVRSSAGAAKAREGMSVVAMWNNGLETRKAEVGRRLRERCARYHQLWLDENGISIPPPLSSSASALPVKVKHEEQDVLATPSRVRTVGLGIATEDSDAEKEAERGEGLPPPPREVVMGAGGLLTPSATRSGGRRVGKRTFHMDPSELERAGLSSGDENDDDDTIPNHLLKREQGKQSLIEEVSGSVLRNSKSMPQLPVTSSVEGPVPAEGEELKSWHLDFPLDNPRVVKPIPLATLPSLTATLTTPRHNKDKPSLLDPLLTPQKAHKFTTSTALPTSSTPTAPNTAGMSLRERIAAKEQLRRTSSLPSFSAPSSCSSSSSTQLTPMQALSQRALVSRLPELCSILFMLFSNGTTLSSSGITRSPTIPMHDLLLKLGKSVKIQLSPRECRSSLEVLQRIAPGFIVVIRPTDGGGGGGTGGKEYVRLGNNADTGALWRLNEVRSRIADELNGKSSG